MSSRRRASTVKLTFCPDYLCKKQAFLIENVVVRSSWTKFKGCLLRFASSSRPAKGLVAFADLATASYSNELPHHYICQKNQILLTAHFS